MVFHLRKLNLFFYDENAKLIEDPDHSEDEERFIIAIEVKAMLFVLFRLARQRPMSQKFIKGARYA